jgi:outer membrane protein assembly factor BamB
MRRSKEKLALPLILVLTFSIFIIQIGPVQSSSSFNPSLLWKNHYDYPSGTKDNCREWSSPTVVNGIVFISCRTTVDYFPYYPNPPKDYVPDAWNDYYAFNATDGATIWDYHLHLDQGGFTSCVYENGAVFFGRTQYGNCSIYALNATSGDLLWEFPASGITFCPAVANGIVYATVGDLSSCLYALNAQNGNLLWNVSGLGGTQWTKPYINNGVVYIGSRIAHQLNALDAANGKSIWNFSTEDIVMSVPVVAEDMLYFSSDKNIYALNAATGTKIWNYSTVVYNPYAYLSIQGVQYEFSSPSFSNGIVYINSNRAIELYALKASDGTKLWNYTWASGNPPTVAEGVAYVTYDNRLIALNAYSGQKIWEYTPAPGSAPTVYQGMLYFAAGSNVYAFKLPPPTISPSPTIVQALTDQRQTVNISLTGNMTSSQIFNVYITSDKNATKTTMYLTLTGESGNKGFCNMTIPKSLICNQTKPTIYIGGQTAANQGYTQDDNSFYVWYTTGFSTHDVSIVFQKTVDTLDLAFYFWAVLFSVLVIAVFAGISLMLFRRHQRQIQKQNKNGLGGLSFRRFWVLSS